MMCCDKIYISITCQVVVYRIQIETIASPCLTQFILLSSTKKTQATPSCVFHRAYWNIRVCLYRGLSPRSIEPVSPPLPPHSSILPLVRACNTRWCNWIQRSPTEYRLYHLSWTWRELCTQYAAHCVQVHSLRRNIFCSDQLGFASYSSSPKELLSGLIINSGSISSSSLLKTYDIIVFPGEPHWAKTWWGVKSQVEGGQSRQN